jgi:hypothetical protein
MLLGVVVVLHPDPAEERMCHICHVAASEDTGHVGPAHLVDEHAVLERDAAAREQIDVGWIPTAAIAAEQSSLRPDRVSTASTRPRPSNAASLSAATSSTPFS